MLLFVLSLLLLLTFVDLTHTHPLSLPRLLPQCHLKDIREMNNTSGCRHSEIPLCHRELFVCCTHAHTHTLLSPPEMARMSPVRDQLACHTTSLNTPNTCLKKKQSSFSVSRPAYLHLTLSVQLPPVLSSFVQMMTLQSWKGLEQEGDLTKILAHCKQAPN